MSTIGIINGEVDASRAISESDDELVIPAVLAREAVLMYPKGRAFRSAKELEAALVKLSHYQARHFGIIVTGNPMIVLNYVYYVKLKKTIRVSGLRCNSN